MFHILYFVLFVLNIQIHERKLRSRSNVNYLDLSSGSKSNQFFVHIYFDELVIRIVFHTDVHLKKFHVILKSVRRQDLTSVELKYL